MHECWFFSSITNDDISFFCFWLFSVPIQKQVIEIIIYKAKTRREQKWKKIQIISQGNKKSEKNESKKSERQKEESDEKQTKAIIENYLDAVISLLLLVILKIFALFSVLEWKNEKCTLDPILLAWRQATVNFRKWMTSMESGRRRKMKHNGQD